MRGFFIARTNPTGTMPHLEHPKANTMDEIVKFDWKNFTSTMAMIGCFVWGITKGLPEIVDSFQEESKKMREEYREDSKIQRADFREELQTQREWNKLEHEARDAAINRLVESLEGASP